VIRVSPDQSAIGAALMALGVPAFYYWKRNSRIPDPGSRFTS
jgi:hypothetical protein